MDRISNVPPGIIENILCLMPTQEAVRTSILSREWRYRWTKIPKLVFEEEKFQVSADGAELPAVEQTDDGSSDAEKLTKRHNFLNAICKVLLMHEGPLREFTLSMLPDERCLIGDTCPELDNIIYHLSRKNTVKKLEIDFEFGAYRLPLSLFSFHHLTDLCLKGCEFVHQPTFNGFRSLTSLSFEYIYISKKSLLHFLSTCPLLKTLTLGVSFTFISHSIDTFTIIDLFECLPMIESLSIPFGIFEIFKPFVHGRVPRELPTTLHLKFLYMHDVCFTQKQNDGLSILVLLMKSSPKLEKIEIDNLGLDEDDSSMEDESFTEDDLNSFKLENYSDIWLKHMRELHIVKFKNWGNELNFVKLILAKSPVLKKVWMRIDYRLFDEDEALQMYQMLLSSPRASPVVDVIV